MCWQGGPRRDEDGWRSTWVGHDDDNAVGAVLDDLRDDVLEDVDVALDEVEAALSLLLADAGCDHHDA